jgi:hypothetical protein
MESSSTKGNIRHGKLKSQKELKRITDSEEYKKSDYEGKTKKLNVATANKGMSVGQAKIAAKAPPPNKIDAKDFAVLRAEKAKGRGMGLQDEKVQPGKVMKANLGILAMKKAKDKGAKGAEFLSPIAMAKRMFNKKSGGVIKAKRGVFSSGKISDMSFDEKMKRVESGQINKKTGKFTSMNAMRDAKGFQKGESAAEFNKRRMKLAGAKKALASTRIGKIVLPIAAAGVAAQQYLKSKMKKKDEPKKKMGGGMMQKPMGYKTGGPSTGFKSKQDRKKFEKNIKEARSKEGLRSFLSSGNKINQPMRKERYMEGRKARHTEFKKKIGRTALGIASSLNPVTSIARGIGKVMGKGSKKRDFQKGDYGDISVKKNMGGMMMQRPMGYNKGVMVKARGCKLGRTRPTKIT